MEKTGLFDGQPDGAPLIRESVHDALANPPYGVGDEFYAPFRIEAFDRIDQPNVSFIYQIFE